MPQGDHFSRILSPFCFFTLSKYKPALTVMALCLAGFSCQAQEQSPVPAAVGEQASTPNAETTAGNNILVPAGTRIALVLTHPVQSRYIHRGDDIYAQITSPVTSGDEVVIPPGTFVQGKVEKLERKGGRGELHLQSMSVTFPDGYVTPFSGPVTLESGDGYALRDPGRGRIISAFALPAAGAGLGALIGSAAHTTQIGSMVGLAVGGVASLVMLTSSHNVYLDVGSPVEMVLRQPLSLERERVADAGTQVNTRPVQAIAKRPQPPHTPTGTCYTPSTPGTPPTIIPGRPSIGNMPGTPVIVIPGTPGIPGTPIPCS